MNREKQIVQLIEKMLENKGIYPTDIKDEFQYKQAIARIKGKQFTISDYALALIFSQLSAQRPWYQIGESSEKETQTTQRLPLRSVRSSMSFSCKGLMSWYSSTIMYCIQSNTLVAKSTSERR